MSLSKKTMFLYLKALHIIFVVTWFSGLFYIVRLFIYHTEALEKTASTRSILTKQFQYMSKRLWYIITWPSAILTLVWGISLVYRYAFSMPTWLWVKLSLVVMLYMYHLKCHWIFCKLQRNEKYYTTQQLRLWNELATLLLVAIVFLAVLKNTLDMLAGLLGWLFLGIILVIAIALYKKINKP